MLPCTQKNEIKGNERNNFTVFNTFAIMNIRFQNILALRRTQARGIFRLLAFIFFANAYEVVLLTARAVIKNF